MKKQHLKLTEIDECYLTTLLSKGQLPARVFRRATALLQLDQGASLSHAALSLQVALQSVMRWRDAYLENGLQFLFDQQRQGRPHKFDGHQRARVTALACSAPPAGYARWSLRLLADRAVELNLCENISKSTVRAVLKKINSNRTSEKHGAFQR
jgi:putative transposase